MTELYSGKLKLLSMSHSLFHSVCWPDSRSLCFFFWGMDTQTIFSTLFILYPNMAALEILKWILSLILCFHVHFLQSILLLDCRLCYFDIMSRVTLNCQSSSWGWLFKIRTLLWKCRPWPVMSVTVPSPCLPHFRDFVCNASYFFLLFLSFLSFSSQCCYLLATITFLFKWHTLSRSCRLQPRRCSTPN